MFTAHDALQLEQGEVTQEEAAKLLQKAINAGMWSLQGSYGRSMMDAIKAGKCMAGLHPAFDAYNNRIPSRHEVKEGTQGSRQFVVDRMGEDWVVMLESVDE